MPRRVARSAQVRRRRAVAALTVGLVAMSTWAALADDPRPHARSVQAPPATQPAEFPPVVATAVQSPVFALDRLIDGRGFIVQGGGNKREIALTFDDGPGPYTQAVLGVLQKLQVRATFFDVGNMQTSFHALTAAEAAAGHVIGNHTQTHAMLNRLSPRDQRRELLGAAQRIQAAGAPYPRLFRPPFGLFDETTLAELRRHRMLMVLWSTDTRDYTQPGVSTIVSRALAGAKPGAIILMHDAGGTRSQTVAAVPAIVRGLRRRGYRLVTVPQLVADDPPPANQQLPGGLGGA
ncbi:MAG TPA: polysaccharide deacetylase family protein [Solirubrobacteraceae bacterium]|nr:polysaccharide deacetylase family protein [Solirubrobacteraceae bacterium]